MFVCTHRYNLNLCDNIFVFFHVGICFREKAQCHAVSTMRWTLTGGSIRQLPISLIILRRIPIPREFYICTTNVVLCDNRASVAAAYAFSIDSVFSFLSLLPDLLMLHYHCCSPTTDRVLNYPSHRSGFLLSSDVACKYIREMKTSSAYLSFVDAGLSDQVATLCHW